MHYRKLLLIFTLLIFVLPLSAQLPAWYQSTTRLNIRTYPSTNARIITTVPQHTRLKVVEHYDAGWDKLDYQGRSAYASRRYLSFVEVIEPTPSSSSQFSSSRSSKSLSDSGWSWLWIIVGSSLVIIVLRAVLMIGLGLFSCFVFKIYWLVSLPFYCLNALQRFLSKPWRIFFRTNSGSDSRNEDYRTFFEYAKIPLYILLTPLRFINAVYYNLFVHCLFEAFYYLCEVIVPEHSKEGADNLAEWFLWLPVRIIKYPMFHWTLTVIESAIWVIIDTIFPALTLFHGTDSSASASITCSPNRNVISGWYAGLWKVGTGNYAGNGIYFAPSRSTAGHYSSGSLIVARVTLGKVLDLGMAPWHIYCQCGYPNAFGPTDWGLKNGYVTGEWWRGDRKWWEYCMYDWKNRYNYSFRIRPLFVLDISNESIQRIPGGMAHWLFRDIVIKDIINYLGGTHLR